MIIHQLSVFIENKPGAMMEVLAVLKENQVNIRALSLADTADFGILRMIVNEPEKIQSTLRDAGYAVKISKVLTLTLDDDPGSLHEKVLRLSEAGINIEYLYAFAGGGDSFARVVLKVDNLELASKIANGEQGDQEDNYSFYW